MVTARRPFPLPVPASKARADPRLARSGTTVATCAQTAAIRSPVTNSARSHQCEPMSAKAREAPPSAGSTRHESSSGVDSQSWR